MHSLRTPTRCFPFSLAVFVENLTSYSMQATCFYDFVRYIFSSDTYLESYTSGVHEVYVRLYLKVSLFSQTLINIMC